MEMFKSVKAIIVLLIISSCSSKNENNLSKDDLYYLQSRGVLKKGEKVLRFETNGGVHGIEQSGNIITNLRIASYWIEEDESEIHSAFFKTDIDSLSYTYKGRSLTYASEITVYLKNKTSFNFYLDADSLRVVDCYKVAKKLLEK